MERCLVYIFFCLTLVWFCSCNAQSCKGVIENKKVSYLQDLIALARKSGDSVKTLAGNYRYEAVYIDSNGYEVELGGDAHQGIRKIITPPYPNLIRRFEIYFPNGQVESEGEEFTKGGFKKGVWNTYDSTGKLLMAKDYDRPFRFGYEDVLEYLKKKGINPLTTQGFKLERTDLGEPFWRVVWSPANQKLKFEKIDGITGKILDQGDEDQFGM